MDCVVITKVLAAMFGASVLGSAVFIFSAYIYRFGFTWLTVHILTIAISYIAIVFATIISIYRELYPLQSTWFALIIIGYVLGAVSLGMMAGKQFKIIRGLYSPKPKSLVEK